MGMSPRRIVQSRFVQFLAIGGALYVLAKGAERRVVEVDPVVLADLHEAQAKKLGVPALSDDGRREVDARAIEDEILYREAMRLGLDRDDPIVKQRLAQKLLLLVEDLGGASRDPSDAELRAHLVAHPERFVSPSRYRYVHVFATRRETLPGPQVFVGDTPPPVGDAFPYPRLVSASRAETERLLGTELADAVVALTPGTTSEALRSPFGWHRVRLLAREDARPPPFAEVKNDVALDFLLERRERVVGKYMVDTAATYDIRVGAAKLEGFVPTRRVAARTEGSGED